jgi:hypothetical protein
VIASISQHPTGLVRLELGKKPAVPWHRDVPGPSHFARYDGSRWVVVLREPEPALAVLDEALAEVARAPLGFALPLGEPRFASGGRRRVVISMPATKELIVTDELQRTLTLSVEKMDARCFAVAPDGGLAIADGATLTLWRPDGSRR